MARAYSDDLRLRVLEAYELNEGSCRILAVRFGVSWEYVRKVVKQHAQSGQRRRVPQSRFGPPSRVTAPVADRLLALVQAQPDITIEELRERIAAEAGVSMSWTLTQNWTRRLDLRLKKSRFTPSSEIPSPTENGGPSSTEPS
jgi:transposase